MHFLVNNHNTVVLKLFNFILLKIIKKDLQMANEKYVELYVYFIDNQYKFCIDGRFIEFNKIISILKNTTTKNKKICSSENLLYKFKVTILADTGGNDSSGFTFELTLTKINNKSTIPNNPIKITEIKNKENSFIVNDEEINCDDIFDLLKKLIKMNSTSSEFEKMGGEERKAEIQKILELAEPKQDYS